MLVDFSVENFLSFNDRQTISFEPDTSVKGLEDYYYISISDPNKKRKPLNLLKIAMVYGANASGKSNLLCALSFLKTLIESQQEAKNTLLDFEPFALNSQINSRFEINFIANQTKYNYKIEFNKFAVISEELNVYPYLTSSKYKCVYHRFTNIDKQVPVIEFNSRMNVDSLVQQTLSIYTLSNETVLAGFAKISADIKPIKDVKDWIRTMEIDFVSPQMPLYYDTISMLEKGEFNVSDVVNMLRNADFNISNIRLKKQKIALRDLVNSSVGKNISPEISGYLQSGLQVKINSESIIEYSDVSLKHTAKGNSFELPLKLESDGTKRYLGLIGILMYLKKESKIVVLDELESSLHPELYEAFLTAYLKNSTDSQLLFTTHNREFLRRQDLIRKDSLWITNKCNDASTEIYSFSDFDSSEINIYNAYAIGKFGGTPNISSDLLFIEE